MALHCSSFWLRLPLSVSGPFKQCLDEEALQFYNDNTSHRHQVEMWHDSHQSMGKSNCISQHWSRNLLLEFLSSTSQLTLMKHLPLVLSHKIRRLQSPVLWHIEMLAPSIISEWITYTQYIWHWCTNKNGYRNILFQWRGCSFNFISCLWCLQIKMEGLLLYHIVAFINKFTTYLGQDRQSSGDSWWMHKWRRNTYKLQC
jgi:hypothetical protein